MNYQMKTNDLFLSLLTTLFIGLKLAGVIHWSWWWVLSPIWISALIFLFLLLVFIVINK